MENMENLMKKEDEKQSYPLARAYLGRVNVAEQKVKRLEMRIENMRLLLTGTSIQLSDMPRSDSPDQEKMATLYAEIDALEREKTQAEEEVAEIRIEVGRLICKACKPNNQQILILLYLQHSSWKEITEKLKICRSNCFQMRNDGLEDLEQFLKKHKNEDP